MKRNISYILGFIAVAMLASCVKVDIHPVQVDDTAMVSLTLKSTEPVATRADGDAVTELNENLISSVQCFFSNDGENILFSARKENLNDSDGTVDNLNLEISSADLANLNSTCHVFAVVNCAELSIPEDKTIATLKSSTEIALSKSDNTTQTSFVMVGAANNLIKADNKLSGTVKVKRVAAKVNVILKVDESIEVKNGDQTETWVPYFNADGDEDSKISLTFSGKAKTVLADADIVAETQNPSFNSTDDFDVTATAFDGLVTPADNVYTVTMQVPFYTYPMSWEGQNNITLRLPWKQVAADGTTVVRYATYEYQIPVQYENKKLLSNNEYELTVNVGILGNLGTTVLTPSYQVANWGTGEINAELSRPKYLVVEKNLYVMNNETSLKIPFHSSDVCTISSSSCVQNHLTNSEDNPDDPTHNLSADGSTNRLYSINIEGENIVVKHGLNNNLYDETNDSNGVFDFTPYEFTLTIQHNGDSSFSETITIIQYPAVHGELQENSGSSSRGYAFVNSYNDDPVSGVEGFCSVMGSASGSGVNSPYMTIVSVSSLQGTDYVIGDPRVVSHEDSDLNYKDTSSPGKYNWATAKALYNGTSNRKLMYYLPAQSPDTFSDETTPLHPTYNMVAPKFRICSGYSAIDGNYDRRRYLDYMKGRCASYQEDGYPAGRWRLPTQAELELINTLCERGLLPDLFADQPYWTAHGCGQYTSGDFHMIHTNDRGSTSVSVRCVYDDWYWGSEPALKTDAEKKVFTWGDEPR